TLGDFIEFTHGAKQRGIRVLIDLVVNHTSDQHPWFKQARSDPNSKYRDWYVWSKKKPPRSNQGMVFPGVQKTTWSYDREAKAWYFHRFYDFQPDLNTSNPEVQAEILKIMGFWIQAGVSGFRMDAVPFIIGTKGPNVRKPKEQFDMGRLQEKQRQAVFKAFGPDENMQLYDRGIRRRLAPMLGGDQRRLELAYSLMFTLPGTAVVRYGDELGMGDDLSLKERECA